MSVAFAAPRQRGKGEITPAAIQKMLDENNHLIQCIMDYQNKGKTSECSQYQQMLHTNLVYLATIADSNQNMQSLLPAPPTQNMPMGPGGMNQSGPPPPPRSHNMPSDGMVGGGPPAPHMQNQMNGQMPGPNHMPIQGPGPNQLNMTNSSMNMPSSSHGSMGGYNHSVPSSQSVPVQNQMTMSQGQPIGSYGPRPNMNMQPNQAPMMHQQPPSQQYNMPQGGGQHYQGQQPPMGMMGQVNQGNHMMGQRQIPPYRPPQQGPPQQYSGQEDYYGDQYSHGGQGPPEGMNQQYYPDGHNDYGYQQPSYPEQGYDRPYEDSSQHYYEGGNSQYGQQQDAYQGPPPQQGYPPQQQQYPGQQGYPGQQQGYGPSQGGPGPQYPNYPQGQGQQYGGYRPTQPGPPQPPQQRPYGYDQVNYLANCVIAPLFAHP
ncbi:protein SSXT isoform X5 [Panthera uncia]|uniref:protein SSXT isoform X5 n=2 Tax=Panthera uncia TaxID=29064 RepID=UPI0020FFAFFC|nr:protein SSXT isoform X5 [Panthera uncia]